ncbi:MAG: M56 family metallopeptidase, partial [Albidovulum sp.]|uniref:M56 family metallopeptidase n=1 Tax=Albidovulum sp. TaxID=1872424 RepID=UPI003CAE550B
MTNASPLLDAYFEVNALLVFTCLIWVLFARLLDAAGLGHAVTARLRLLRVLFLAVIISPLFVAGLGLALRAGILTPEHSVNLTDFVISQYLQGRFEMNPAELERMLGFRGEVTRLLSGPLGLGLMAFLATGFTAFAVRLGLSYLKLRRIISESYVWRRIGRVELRLSDTVTVPFSTRGLRSRIVVLPSGMLANECDLEIALGHELQHLRQGDVEWEIALGLIQPFLFWNPAFYLWKRQVEELRELSCDRQVLARRGYNVADYCDCLLRVCHDGLHRRRLLAVEVPVVALVRTEGGFFGRRAAVLLKRRMMTVIEGRAERH